MSREPFNSVWDESAPFVLTSTATPNSVIAELVERRSTIWFSIRWSAGMLTVIRQQGSASHLGSAKIASATLNKAQCQIFRCHQTTRPTPATHLFPNRLGLRNSLPPEAKHYRGALRNNSVSCQDFLVSCSCLERPRLAQQRRGKIESSHYRGATRDGRRSRGSRG